MGKPKHEAAIDLGIAGTLAQMCAGTREIYASHLKFLPLVPRFSLFVLPQGAVKPAQVYHGDVVSWAQTDGLPVVGHSSLWSPWRTKRLLNRCLRKILWQIQHEAMLWVFYQLLSGTILRKKFGKVFPGDV